MRNITCSKSPVKDYLPERLVVLMTRGWRWTSLDIIFRHLNHYFLVPNVCSLLPSSSFIQHSFQIPFNLAFLSPPLSPLGFCSSGSISFCLDFVYSYLFSLRIFRVFIHCLSGMCKSSMMLFDGNLINPPPFKLILITKIDSMCHICSAVFQPTQQYEWLLHMFIHMFCQI